MNSSSSDSIHPAPEDSSADERNDADGSSSKTEPPPAVVLPPRRTTKDQPISRSVEGRNVGLRIDTSVKRGKDSNPPRLKIQEIHGGAIRLDQTAPGSPRPPRKEIFHERTTRHKNSEQSRGEGAGWGNTHHHPTLWLLGSGAAVIAIVVCAMILLPSLNKQNAPRAGTQAKAVDLNQPKEAEVLLGLPAKQSEAIRIFHAYITASHVDEIVPLVRNGATMTNLLGKNWRPSTIPKSWVPAADSNWTVAEQDGDAYGILQGALPDGSKFTAYFSHESDRLQLDWKATVAYGSATFAELVKNQGNPAEIRGVISPTNFYTATWPESDYQSYRLLSADKETSIWCYTRRGSAAEESIAPHFSKSGITGDIHDSRRITLQLERGPEGSLPNQWLIGEVLHLDWITP